MVNGQRYFCPRAELYRHLLVAYAGFYDGSLGDLMEELSEAGASRPVVLVVDDEAAIRAFLCEYLRDYGFHALGLESADNAVRLLNLGLAADLVFSDVRMPGRYDGFGLARWIAEHRPGLPVILTTGDIGKENAAA